MCIRDRSNAVLIRQCSAGERWEGLWDFPRFECQLHQPNHPSVAEEDPLSGQLRQLTKYSGTEYEWLTLIKHGVTKYRISLHCYESKLTGRRPIFISSEPISNQQNVLDFVQISGEIVGFATDVSIDSFEKIAGCANEAGLTNLKLRYQIDPNLQPKLQSAIDQEMKILNSNLAACPGFLTEAGEGYVICRQA